MRLLDQKQKQKQKKDKNKNKNKTDGLKELILLHRYNNWDRDLKPRNNIY